MAIRESDIKFLYSSSNIGSEISLGGSYSSEITGKFLFSDINQEKLADGLIDYRCLYLKNNNPSDKFDNFEISITEYTPSYIEFGFEGAYSINSVSSITNVVGDGEKVIYTTSNNHSFAAGQKVSITGISGEDLGGYNTSAIIDSVTNNTFTITSTATGEYVSGSGGTASQTTIKFIEEEQVLTINYSAKPTEGENSYFYLQYEDKVIKINWRNDIQEQENELKNKLKNLDDKLKDFINVIYLVDSNTTRSFRIIISNQRANDKITLAEDITIDEEATNPLGLIILSETIGYGGPATGTTRSDSANLIKSAVDIGNPQTAPSVSFFDVTKSVKLNHFYPGDYLAIWIKRTIIADSAPSDGDGFSINISATGTTVDVTRSPLCPTCPPAGTPVSTPTLTPGPTETIGPTSTPASTATLAPTLTPTLTPTATPFGWTPEPTPTSTPTLTPTATQSSVWDCPTRSLSDPPYNDGDIVTICCSPSRSITTDEQAGVTLTINGNPDAYCPYFLIQFKYITINDTDLTPINLRFYFRTSGNDEIEVASIDLFKGYSDKRFLFNAKLCNGATVDLSKQDFTVNNSPIKFTDGVVKYGFGDDDGNPLPEQNEC